MQTFPFFGIVPVLLSDEGKEIEGAGEGYLVSIKRDPIYHKSLSMDWAPRQDLHRKKGREFEGGLKLIEYLPCKGTTATITEETASCVLLSLPSRVEEIQS